MYRSFTPIVIIILIVGLLLVLGGSVWVRVFPITKPSSTPTAVPKANDSCVRAGCSNQLCVDATESGIVTSCEWRDEYACYQSAECTRQANGQCGFTASSDLTSCLNTTKR